jgi:hypothetical protein
MSRASDRDLVAKPFALHLMRDATRVRLSDSARMTPVTAPLRRQANVHASVGKHSERVLAE